MRHLPLIIAVFLILAAGFLASSINVTLTSNSVKSYYGERVATENGEVTYRTNPPGSGIDNTRTIPLERFDVNGDGKIDKDDVRDHNNWLLRCLDQLWGIFCIPQLDIDGNGRYERRDNTILYHFVLDPTTTGQSYHDVKQDRTDECELGRLRCVGEQRYQQCGNFDGSALKWSHSRLVDDVDKRGRGKICRNNKIVDATFNPSY